MKYIFVSIMLFGLSFIPALYAQTPAAVIRESNGKVEIQTPGNDAWIPASAGMVIENETRISTGFRSTALVVLGDVTLMVRPLTRLSLEEITALYGKEQIGLYLETGRVRAEVSPPRGGTINFTVRSPTVVASVRGTSFEFDTINLTVSNGTVQYAGKTDSFALVRAGERSTVDEKTYIVTPPREETILTFAPPLPPGSEAGGRLNGDGPLAITGNPGNPGPPGNPGSDDLIITGGW
jgi:hypothetical protein